MGILELLIRFTATILVLLIMARLNGPKQISQMNFYDYVVGIAVGSIAANSCINKSMPLWIGITAIVLLFLTGIFMSWLARKSLALRRFLSGKPIVLIAGGNLQWDGLRRAKMNVNELQSKLRYNGYFDIEQVNYAILEPTGDLSVQPKGFARPPMAQELDVQVKDASLLANVILDGSILLGNLQACGKDETWLKNELKKQEILSYNEIGLATLDKNDTLSIYIKKANPSPRTYFI